MKNKQNFAPWYGYVIVGLLCLGIFIPNFAQYQVTSLADRLRTEMGLSQGQYGSIATAPLLAGIILSFLSGLLMDRYGVKVVVVAVGISAVGIVLRGFTAGYWPLFISMLLMGFAASFVNANTPKIAGSWFPSSKVTAMMGLVLAFSNMGSALGTGTAPQFATTAGAFGSCSCGRRREPPSPTPGRRRRSRRKRSEPPLRTASAQCWATRASGSWPCATSA